MTEDRRRYVWYDDMKVVHIENGYIAFLLILLMFYNIGVVVALFIVPGPEAYFVPGLKSAQEVRVIWGHEYGASQSVANLLAPQVKASAIAVPEPEVKAADIQIEDRPLVVPGRPIPMINLP